MTGTPTPPSEPGRPTPEPGWPPTDPAWPTPEPGRSAPEEERPPFSPYGQPPQQDAPAWPAAEEERPPFSPYGQPAQPPQQDAPWQGPAQAPSDPGLFTPGRPAPESSRPAPGPGWPAPEPGRSAPGEERPPYGQPAPRHAHQDAPRQDPPGAPWPSQGTGTWPQPPQPGPAPEARPGTAHPAPTPQPGLSHPGSHPAPAQPVPPTPKPPQPAQTPPPQPRPAPAPPARPGRSWFAESPAAFPDQQVWPPAAREEHAREEHAGISTQPFPAVPASPLPPRRPVPAMQPLGMTQEPPPPDPVPTAPQADGTEPDGPDGPADPPPPRRGRTALLATGAVLALAVAIAVPTLDGYSTYLEARPPDQVHVFAAGQTASFRHVSWQVSVEAVDTMPNARPIPADRQWLKIRLTRVALDQEGIIRRAAPDVEVRALDGRVWKVEPLVDDLPLEVKDYRVGAPYHYDMVSMVPRALAAQVEVYVRPSPARMIEGESVQDMFKRTAKEQELKDNVLRFRR
ncbi:hypothetical protein [Streptosporangium saharense]|uniref:Uncharacterized protein n=1 Tax=Streptosporangium saharense TaxID=1706840 RepID=A0A7W7VL25_9ACTN|nr:hypothetical protein [Streptosporangium saharense]MBB4913740.1 hypothetical protein [Streptosporangium saharense]